MSADAAGSEGRRFRTGLAAARELVARFDPDLVVMFGSDHRRAYEPVIPAISVVLEAEGYGDHGSPTGPYAVPGEAAESLLTALLDGGVDAAASRGVKLDHGFGETVGDLLGGLDARPIIPVFVNCATPPLISPARAVELGGLVHRFLTSRHCADKVLVVGSGGLSHSPPTLGPGTFGLSEAERKRVSAAGRERARASVNPDWDAEILRRLAGTDPSPLESLRQEHIDPGGVGANEIRTWLAAWAAAGRHPLATLAYEPVPEWITGMGVAASSWACEDLEHVAEDLEHAGLEHEGPEHAEGEALHVRS
jgi:2,3-dihydroxyphenylpropionate 1,2-dioxygenase